MTRTKMVALALAGIILPVAIVVAAWLLSRSTLADTGTVPPLAPSGRIWTEGGASAYPSQEGDHGGNRGPGSSDTPAPTTQPSPSVTDDHGGKCSEPEHANDPECLGGSGGSSGSSGSGGSGDSGGSGGGDDSSKSGSSGSSGGSGSNSSGSGSSGDD